MELARTQKNQHTTENNFPLGNKLVGTSIGSGTGGVPNSRRGGGVLNNKYVDGTYKVSWRSSKFASRGALNDKYVDGTYKISCIYQQGVPELPGTVGQGRKRERGSGATMVL
jgi:hypothetical protein